MDQDTIVYIVLEVILAMLSILGNALVCYVVLHSRVLRKKVMYMFVTSLALADICVGAIAIPFAILTKLGLPRSSPFFCVAMLSFIMIPTQISIFNLMAISVERYLSIRHPRLHYNMLTLDKSLTVVVLTWILSAVIGMLPLFGWNKITNLPVSTKFLNESIFDQRLPFILNFQTNSDNQTSNDIIQPRGEMCEFMKVMEFDYMFFNFVVCVLPPLVVSAILYFVIFVSVLRVQENRHPTSTNANDSPTFIHRDGSTTTSFHKRHLLKNTESVRNADGTSYLVQKLASLRDVPMMFTPSMLHKHRNHHKTTSEQNQESIDTLKQNAQEIQLKVESPSSSAVAHSCHEGEKDNTSGLSVGQSILDKHLLSDRLSKLASTQSNPGKHNVICTYEPKVGTCCSKINSDSTVSTYSSTPCRSRVGTDEFQAAKKRHHAERHHKRMREIRAATVLALIVLSFAICWMPIHVLNTIHRFDPKRNIPAYIYNVAILLSHCNSTVNFFLYSWRLKAFRLHLHRRVIDKIFHRQ